MRLRMASKLGFRAIGIRLLLVCSVVSFLLCFTYIDARAFYSNGKELQVLLQSLGYLDHTGSLNSHATVGDRSDEFGLPNGRTLESQTDSQSKVLEPEETIARNKSLSGCEISQGHWVHDETYPLYRSTNCPFLDPAFRCVENGRPDTDFMKYRWQPHDCDLPR